MEIGINLTLDDGFLRRECPNCERQFKWHHGPTDDRPDDAVDPPMYHCPYCGLTADSDEWETPPQREYIEDVALGHAVGMAGDMLEDTFRNTKGVRFEASGGSAPAPPGPPPEPHDMVGVEPPCHPWEPIKVVDDWDEALHCIVCGERFATN
jgi:hypothetical protein